MRYMETLVLPDLAEEILECWRVGRSVLPLRDRNYRERVWHKAIDEAGRRLASDVTAARIISRAIMNRKEKK